MAGGLELITPLHVYLNNPSTKGLVDLLDYWSKYHREISKEQINSLTISLNNQIDLDHESFYEFDQQFWQALSRFDISIDWWRYISVDEFTESSNIESVPQQIQEAVATAFLSDLEVKGKVKDTAALYFFAEVDELISEIKDSQRFKDYSVQISTYLNEISKTPPRELGIKSHPQIQKELWDWLFSTYFQALVKCLAKNHKEYCESGKESPSSGYLAEEFSIFYSAVYFALLSIHNVTSLNLFSRELNFLSQNIKFIKNPMIEAWALTVNNEEPVLINKETVQIWTSITCLLLSICRSDKFVSDAALDIFFKAYTDQSWEIAYEDFSGILHDPIIAFFTSYGSDSEPESDFINHLLGKFIPDSFDINNVYKYLSRFDDRGNLSLESIKKILFETCLSYWDEDGTRIGLLERVANLLVKRVNQEFSVSGFPIALGLHGGNEEYDFIRPFPAYYQSVSTLAINLGQQEFSSNFDDTNPTHSYVEAANALNEAGLTDHAIILLGYGLVRICSGVVYETDFSIKEVNAFILKPEIWSRLEKQLLPFLDLCSKFETDKSFATRIWIKSIQDKFSRAQLHLVNLDTGGSSKSVVEQLFKMPHWFPEGDESLSRSLKDLRSLSDRQNEMTSENWQRYFVAKTMKSKLVEVSQSLESTSLDLFSPIHSLFITNDKFNDAFNSIGARLRAEQRMDLGWIEFLIRAIQEADKRKPNELKKLIDIANESNTSLGKTIYQIRKSHEGVLNSFQYFRRLDNMYLSHKSIKSNHQMSQSDANWLYTYAMSDFKFIADLFI